MLYIALLAYVHGKLPLEGKNLVFVVAPSNFRDEEVFIPRDYLSKRGAKIVIASVKKGTLRGMLGGKIKAEMLLEEIKPEKFDGIVLPGGVGATVYFKNKVLHNLLWKFYKSKKLVAAICLSPSTLARAGLLKGKKATVWKGEAKTLKKLGAIYIAKPVVRDGNIITAWGPDAAGPFAKEIEKFLIGRKK